MDKQSLRRYYKALRDDMGEEMRNAHSQAIAQWVLAWDVCMNAKCIFMYHSMGSEVHTHDLMDALLSQGKKVCLPRIIPGPLRQMEAVWIQSGRQLVEGPFGTREPDKDAPDCRPDEIDLVLVPGLAFTKQGIRLGYGGGYYDRFLTNTSAIAAGMCFSAQVVDELPNEVYDKNMRFLVDENGVMFCREAYG